MPGEAVDPLVSSTVSATRAWRRARSFAPLALLVLASVLAAAFYVGAFALRGLQAPVADDSFFYVRAVRTVTGAGLADAHLLARPAFPLLAATLGSPVGASAWTIAIGLPIAMAIGLGLAGTALAERWNVPRWTTVAFVVLVALSSPAARLVAGKNETLLTLWLLGAALSVAVWGGGRKGAIAIAALAFVAGLAEWPFLALFVGIVVIGLVAFGRRAGRGAEPGAMGAAALTSTLVLAAAAVAFVVFGIDRTGVGDAVQRLPPSFRYGLRLRNETSGLWPFPTVGLFLIGWWAARRRRAQAVRVIWGVMTAWLAVAALALVVGLAGAKLPTYRVITFTLPLALGAAAAPIVLAVAAGRQAASHRVAIWATAVVLAALALVPATFQWFRDLRPRTNAREMGEIASAGAYAAALPGREPVVLVVDRADVVLGAFYDRVVGAVLPPDRSGRVLVFLGRTEDALAGRATLTGSPSRDQVLRERFQQMAPALRGGAPVLAGVGLDPAGFAAARGQGAAVIPGGVAVARGPEPPAGLMVRPFDALPRWWALLGFALVAVAVMALAGAGWARLALRDAPVAARWELSPAFGGAAIVVIALLFERLGLNLHGPVSVVAVGLALSASAAAWTIEKGLAQPGDLSPEA
jgi:hypothetical protein